MKAFIEFDPATNAYSVGMEHEPAEPAEPQGAASPENMMPEGAETGETESPMEPAKDLEDALEKVRKLLSAPQSTDGGQSPFDPAAEDAAFNAGFKGSPGDGSPMG